MNDFSRYDLQSLLWAINYVRERTNNSGDVMRRLKKDIQQRLDNYCEHENIGIHEWKTCMNCGEAFP